VKIGIWSDCLTLVSFEPCPTAIRFYVVDVPEGWRLAPDFRWPPAWSRHQWSGVVLRGPTGEAINTCDVLGRAHRGADGFRLVADVPIPCREDEESGPCPDGQHKWIRRRMGGPPDAAESYEVVEYCGVCGIENLED
jgi:hypothetical protein